VVSSLVARKMRERLLNLGTAILLLCALAVFVGRVREVFEPAVRGVRATDTLTVRNWRKYGAEGERLGPDSAAVTVVEYADFRCPFCAKAASYLEQLRHRFPHSVAVVYRHYPAGELSRSAAIASQCAAEFGAFQPYHDLLYAEGESIGTESWLAYAASVGIRDSSLFLDCMESPVALQAVVRDTLSAARLGVHGTPTFLINDLLVSGFLDPKHLDDFVDGALSESAVAIFNN
jgi:protein-disulfide isomerase